MKKDINPTKSNPLSLEKFDNFVIFQTKRSKVNVQVFFADDTVWLTQKSISELFEKGRSTITEHISNIFDSMELDKDSVCRSFRLTANDGKSYNTSFYNLRMVTAVGYRVNSQRAIAFRQWATEILHDYIIKGSVLDVERLKNIQHFGKDYFEETLDQVREIRLSERRLYQKITDIYALSADYDKSNKQTNKVVFCISTK